MSDEHEKDNARNGNRFFSNRFSFLFKHSKPRISAHDGELRLTKVCAEISNHFVRTLTNCKQSGITW